MNPCSAASEPRLSAALPCYVRPALEGRRERGLRALRRGGAAALGCLAVLGLGACGQKRQDVKEPKGRFKVDVTRATFPTKQKLAKKSNLVITVRNSGDRTIPNVAVTVNGFYYRVNDSKLADPTRPIFVINGRPKSIGAFPESVEAGPAGGETAYVGTWALGPLRRGQDRTFRWSVTAVKAGPFRIKYTVAAGLHGKAKAEDASGRRPEGVFTGTVSDKPPVTRVAEDGKTVVRGTR
jgi:hypothetical protein